jgi:hypothetical protein
MHSDTKTYGLMASFDSPEALISAARASRDAGYRKLDAYSPMPIEGLSEAIDFGRAKLPWLVLLGGIAGAIAGYGLQYFTSVIDYPWNVGGRPFHSWPAFIPVTFEFTILFAALAAVFGMMALNGLPQPYHPVFNAPGFELASRDRFFLCIEAEDPQFDDGQTRQFLESLQPLEVVDVEP